MLDLDDGTACLLHSSAVAIDIRKSNTLTSVLIEVSGSPSERPIVCAAMLDRDGRLPGSGFMIWPEQPSSPDGALRLSPLGAGHQLRVEVGHIDGAVDEIAFCVIAPIGTAMRTRADVSVVDAMTRGTLGRSTFDLGSSTRMREVGRLVRGGGGWRYLETGRDFGDGLDDMLRRYGVRLPGPVPRPADPQAQFVALIVDGHPTRYCDATERSGLIGRGIALGLDAQVAEAVLDLELERLGIANEAVLLSRLDSMLRRFTDKDRKLDNKERSDALQLVCRPASGFAQGLRHDVADGYVVRFCRERGVKVKTGLFSWAVP